MSVLRESFLISLDEEMKKWLTAADTRREITEGLREWFEQADNVLETAPAEDTDEDDTYNEDSDTDSDYNSVDAEQDVQEDDDDEGQPHPVPKVLPSYKWSHFFRGYTTVRIPYNCLF
jgi:hypothetical protein